jgi:hypothetical protein
MGEKFILKPTIQLRKALSQRKGSTKKCGAAIALFDGKKFAQIVTLFGRCKARFVPRRVFKYRCGRIPTKIETGCLLIDRLAKLSLSI